MYINSMDTEEKVYCTINEMLKLIAQAREMMTSWMQRFALSMLVTVLVGLVNIKTTIN